MRINSIASLFIAALAVVVFASVGCEKPTGDNGPKPAAGGHDDHDHDHGDDHADHDHPAHGPFGGHIFDIDSPDYQGEWKKYSDNNIIRMYLLDGKGKDAVAVKVDSFIVKPQAGKDDVTFELKAEDPDENGASSTYMLDDENLTIAIPLGVDIEIKIGDKTYKSQIKAHQPLDH
jgi:hypothetical protein